jgi:hypothetical protein
MSLMERLRKAEQQGREAAWQGLGQVRTGLEEAQSRLRRKMRIYPRTTKPPVFVSVQDPEDTVAEPEFVLKADGEDAPPEEKDAHQEQVA